MFELKANDAGFNNRIIEQPFKIPFVAAVVLQVNALKPELAALVFNKAAEMAQSHIAAGQWRDVKLLLRFFGCLQGLFEGDGIFPLLEELFSRAVDLQTASSEDVRIYQNATTVGDFSNALFTVSRA